MPAPCNAMTSERLQRVLEALADGGMHSTLELVRATGLCDVSSAIRELKQAPNHFAILRTWRMEPDASGRKRMIHYYRLLPSSRLAALIGEAQRLAGSVGGSGHGRG